MVSVRNSDSLWIIFLIILDVEWIYREFNFF